MDKKRYSFYFDVYSLLRKSRVVNIVLMQIRQRYEMICPASEGYIVRKTVKTLLITWGVIGLELLVILRLNIGITQSLIAAAIAVILHHEILEFLVHSLEGKILTQFEKFLTDVRHHYYVSRMVDEAIWDAMEQTPYEMRVHANRFYEIITSEHCEELADKYHLSSHNNFLNLFLALCVTVTEYGDRIVDGQSLFLLNLSQLKSEVNLELLKLKQMNYLYAGLTFVVISPMTVLKVIEHWAISNLPELTAFYHDGIGYLTAFLIILFTLTIYLTVKDLKEYRLNIPKDYLLTDGLLSVHFILQMVDNFILHQRIKVNKLKRLIDESGEAITVRELVVMKFGYCISGGMICLSISIWYLVQDQGRYDWYELLGTAVVAFSCFHIPELRLMFHRKIAAMGKEEEIIRYQSIVLMLMYIERISVLELLERVEEFSYIFRKEIQSCINDFNYSDQQALEKLKESTNFLPFQRFVDSMMMSDEIGVEKAFDEIAADRQHFQEKRKQENEMNLNKRSELAKFLAYIPAILVIGGYLILPFIIECYNQLQQYQDMMNTAFY